MLGMVLAALGVAAVDGDQRLVRRALRGHGDAVRALVDRLMPVIRAQVAYGITRRAGRVQAGRDDYAQEIWLALWAEDGKRLRAYEPGRGATFEGYVGVVAERLFRSLLRKEVAQKRGGDLHQVDQEALDRVHAEGQGPAAQVEARRDAEALWAHLQTVLPERGQLVFRLIYTDGLTVDDAAAALGVNRQVVYNWQFKIRNAAKAFLGEGA